MRKISDEIKKLGESLKIEPKATDECITQTRSYKIITPLFGGGVAPRENDELKLIRETSIRGQLRFWWRAMRGSGSLSEMKKREDAIFGSASQEVGQSKILIAVRDIRSGKAEALFEINEKKRLQSRNSWQKIAYAAFALQPNSEELRDNSPMRNVRTGVEFTLNLSFPASKRADIEAALWAWETFGGIGGRTRRGFGALELDKINGETINVKGYKAATIEAEIKVDLAKYLLPNKTCDENMPHLTINSIFRTKQANDVKNAWENLIQKLKDFRQSPRTGNNYKGESHWSEPDAIRRIVGTFAVNVKDQETNQIKDRKPSHQVGNKFPRAEFGLPIIIKFKEENQRDPKTQTLKPRRFERLASPLILRPIICVDKKAVGLALILETPDLPELELQGRTDVIETKLNASDIQYIKPMFNADSKEINILKSFLKTI